MSNIRIEKIRLHNFKGVKDMEFSMEGISAIVLGGKNGYGKTTIFDALELVLTGKIARYSDYKESFVDGRRSYSQEERPLVCSQNVENVRIDVYVSIDLGDGIVILRILTRLARTADMKNPVDFDVFRGLRIREKEDDELRLASEEELNALGLSSFRWHYGTLNYMSQEESTKFIKSKDTKRVEDVNFLFNTQQFDRRINKIDKVLLKALKEKTDTAIMQKRQKEQTIQVLQQYEVGEAGDVLGYQRLFQEGQPITWDSERPNLSNEDYSQLLCEGGLLDSIQYMIAHQDDYRKWNNKRILNGWLDQSANYAFYLLYRSREDDITLWKVYQRDTIRPFNALNLQNIAGYQFQLDMKLENIAGEKKLNDIRELLQQVKEDYQAASASQRAYNEMIEQRNKLAQLLHEQGEQLSLQRCPLCGQTYTTFQELVDSIQLTLQLQLTSFTTINDQVAKKFEKLKALITDVLEILNASFHEKGIDQNVVVEYDSLNKKKLSDGVKFMTDHGMLSELPKNSFEETERAFTEEVQSKIRTYDENLDYDRMKQIFDGYVRYMPKELRNIEAVQGKRNYLLQIWNNKKSEQMRQLTNEVSGLQRKINQYNHLESQLRQIKDSIIAQKDAFLKKVITDVEILFYIYSGRIMQDSFYGRGLFMKNVQGKYIYFVSKYSSDFDALYKMSSGQLVALMMSLLLSLNKLYSESMFLAIDDPVQTIDDINVWGFVETIRHEFREHQLLFSTHELSYGSLLRYKFSNMKIKAKYLDMMDLRKQGA